MMRSNDRDHSGSDAASVSCGSPNVHPTGAGVLRDDGYIAANGAIGRSSPLPHFAPEEQQTHLAQEAARRQRLFMLFLIVAGALLVLRYFLVTRVGKDAATNSTGGDNSNHFARGKYASLAACLSLAANRPLNLRTRQATDASG
jgi:hypothetical protein